MIDAFFMLSAACLGWGLSLATYRMVAIRNNWPMGQLHTDAPLLPILIGLVVVIIGVMAAWARGLEFGGLVIIVLGLLLAVFWTGFLRVGSQVSLFLAPAAAGMLVLGLFGAPLPGNYNTLPVGYLEQTPARSLTLDRIEDRTAPAPIRRN